MHLKCKVLPHARIVMATDGTKQLFIDTGKETLPISNGNYATSGGGEVIVDVNGNVATATLYKDGKVVRAATAAYGRSGELLSIQEGDEVYTFESTAGAEHA